MLGGLPRTVLRYGISAQQPYITTIAKNIKINNSASGLVRLYALPLGSCGTF